MKSAHGGEHPRRSVWSLEEVVIPFRSQSTPYDDSMPKGLASGGLPLFRGPLVQAVLERAQRAAGAQDVSLVGGASAAQPYLGAGRVDELKINLVPALLGSGERLFDGVGDDLLGFELVRVVAVLRGLCLC